MNIYYEVQRGGMCRLHAINAYFGYKKYIDTQFWKYADEFDTLQKNKYGDLDSCKSFDLINADQCTLVSYILRQNSIYTRYVSPGNIDMHIDAAIASKIFFAFNMDHVWIIKEHNKIWYKVDSMSGVSPINISHICNDKRLGIIIPINNLRDEFKYILNKINTDTSNDIISFLQYSYFNKLFMGNVEIYLAALIDILKVQLNKRPGFKLIENLISLYDEFSRELYCKKLYNDIKFLENKIGPIFKLIKILSNSI
jgi:hypothetical protein